MLIGAACVLAVAVAVGVGVGRSHSPSGGASARRALATSGTQHAAVPATTSAGAGAAVPVSTAPAATAATPVHPGTNRIPILMYHVIQTPGPTVAFPGLWVPPAEFADQMHSLRRAGFTAITMDQAWGYWKYGALLPKHPVIVTFDNGYASQYTNALPILRAMHWVAVMNLQLSLHAPEGLTPKQVRGMIAAGWELDSQTFTHPDLDTASAAKLQYEIVEARRRTQRNYGVPVNWFCYPSGHYNPRVVQVVKQAGFLGSVTVVPGWGSKLDTYRLARLRVLGGTSGAALVDQVLANKNNPLPPIAYPPGA
jgi:peptidoglycan/xylan/chitin deacetylase (PgdA/CDA1 family)